MVEEDRSGPAASHETKLQKLGAFPGTITDLHLLHFNLDKLDKLEWSLILC